MSSGEPEIPPGDLRPGDGSSSLRPVRVLLLTGDRGSGKSTLCERLAGEARRLGVSAGGAACPAVFGPEGEKIGCRIRDLASGEERELGSTIRDLGGSRWKGWSFSDEGFEAANRAVRSALESGLRLVVLDEIGPVELRLGAGLEPSLRFLDGLLARDRGRLCPAETIVVLVVRPELAEELSARYPGAEFLRIDPARRERALELARSALFGPPALGKASQSS